MPDPTQATSMDSAGLAGFFSDAGLAVHEGAGGYWIDSGPRFLLSIPSHRPLHVDPTEAARLMIAGHAAGIRYVAAEEDGGVESFQITASGADYDFDRLSANTRSKTRRGIKRNEIRQISGAELIEHGAVAFRETLVRQRRDSDEAMNAWRRLLTAADREPAVEIWSAWHEGELASYLLIMMIDDICEFYQARSRNELLKHYPNNALIFTLTREMLAERGVREVTFGIESLEDVTDLDRFKDSLGYVHKPIHQKVIFRPGLEKVLNVAPVRGLLRKAANHPAAPVQIRKAAGLLQFAGWEPPQS